MPRTPSETVNPSTAATACPFCSLLCDDLTLSKRADGSFSVERNGCRRADEDFARPPPAPQAFLAGKPVTFDTAIKTAARMLSRARHPLLAGLATDVDGIRAAVNLAERCGGTLDHLHGDALTAMSRILQTRGWYATTLSEVRNRADLIVMLGVDLETSHENFLRRCTHPEQTLDAELLAKRRITYLGATPPTKPVNIDVLPCKTAHLAAVLRGLLALVKGERLTATRIAGLAISKLAALADALKAARYAALVFAPGTLGDDREPAIAAIFDLVDALNRETRAAALVLSGNDGGQTALSTCAWLTGYPLRVNFGKTIHYDPVGLATERLLERNAADVLLWFDAFGRHGLPPARSVDENNIVIASTVSKRAAQAAVFIAAGTPGLDHGARLLRTDAIVSLALSAQRDTALPSVAHVLTAIQGRL